jgi:hypothetical protein
MSMSIAGLHALLPWGILPLQARCMPLMAPAPFIILETRNHFSFRQPFISRFCPNRTLAASLTARSSRSDRGLLQQNRPLADIDRFYSITSSASAIIEGGT